MSNAARPSGFGGTARLVRELDPGECLRRNALTNKRPDVRLRQGATVTVLEELEKGNAFLVEFNERKAAENCDWLGVLYTTEIEFENGAPRA
ncbi:MAG: hypothetical protein R3D68_03770 [Hyphomicrobiaceae bacterium]